MRGTLWLTPTYAGTFVDPESRRASQVRADGSMLTVREHIREDRLKFSHCGASLPNLGLSLALNLTAEQLDQPMRGGTPAQMLPHDRQLEAVFNVTHQRRRGVG